MNTYFSTRIIQQTLICIPSFIALFLIFSCETKAKPQEVTMDYIIILEKTIDSLNLKVDSLNSRMSQLEVGCANNDLVSEMKVEERMVNRQIICPYCSGEGSTQKKCGSCYGSGYYNRSSRECVWCDGTGSRITTCSVCHGNGRVNEYE